MYIYIYIYIFPCVIQHEAIILSDAAQKYRVYNTTEKRETIQLEKYKDIANQMLLKSMLDYDFICYELYLSMLFPMDRE